MENEEIMEKNKIYKGTRKESILDAYPPRTRNVLKFLLITITIMVLTTISYSYFSGIVDNKDETLGLETGTMQLRFADNDNGINASLHFGETITKKFIIENTGTLEASLSLDWLNLTNTYLYRSLSYNLTYSETEDGEYKELVPETNIPSTKMSITSTVASEISVPAGETYYYNLNVTLNNLNDLDQTGDVDANLTTEFTVNAPSKYRYYVLRIDPNGGTWNTFTGPQEYQLKNNESMTIEDPTKVGYTFVGWDMIGTSSELNGTSFEMGITDTYLTAKWATKKINVTIDGVTRQVDYGSTIDLGTPEERENYTFTGWNVTGGTLSGNELLIDTEDDITVTSIFIPNNYKYIVYHNQMNIDGEGYTPVDADTDEGEAGLNTTITPPLQRHM